MKLLVIDSRRRAARELWKNCSRVVVVVVMCMDFDQDYLKVTERGHNDNYIAILKSRGVLDGHNHIIVLRHFDDSGVEAGCWTYNCNIHGTARQPNVPVCTKCSCMLWHRAQERHASRDLYNQPTTEPVRPQRDCGPE